MALPESPSGLQLSPAYKWAWITLFAAGGIYLRMHDAGRFAFDDNEMMHLNIADGDSLAEVIRFSRYEVHPPLFYILLHYWLMLSGSPMVIRLLPLLFGMALLPLYYAIGKRMGGEFCGLCCAMLINFSPACIRQSALIRNYDVFLFFLSLSFYCYLCWHQGRSRWMLAFYALSGLLAGLTHFSAMLYFLCIALYEGCDMLYRRAGRLVFLKWAMVHAALADIVLYVYALYQPGILRYSEYFKLYDLPVTVAKRIIAGFEAPFMEVSYIYPELPMLPALLIFAFAPQLAVVRRPSYRLYFMLGGMACGMSALLSMSGIYTVPGTRRNLWMLPFLLPPMAAMLAEALFYVWGAVNIRIWMLLAVVFFIYESIERFSGEMGDYYGPWANGQWQEIEGRMEGLGSRDLIITDMTGINFLVNPYRAMEDAAFMHGVSPALMPYRKTHVMLIPAVVEGRRRMSNVSFAGVMPSLQDADEKGVFKAIDRIVFLKTWDDLFYGILMCKPLEKDIVFPVFPAGFELGRNTFGPTNFAVISMSRDEFLREILSPAGKAHGCIKEITGDMRPPEGR